jgi:dihydrofolate synthase / folylpolyglutamate synthase
MNYSETMAYLYAQLPFFQKQGEKAYKPKLNNIIDLCDYLGNPQNTFKTVHIAGTNGKGSSSHFLASIMQESGYKTGLYTSPHLKDFRERFRINGKMVQKSFITNFVRKHLAKIQEIQPSFFEVSVAMAFQLFKEEKVEIAIIEVGLGGLWDSTNIILPELSLITNIGLDHTNILGNTIEEIAFQKAGIIKKNTDVVISEYTEVTKPIFQKIAEENNSPIFFAQDEYSIDINSKNSNALELNIQNKTQALSVISGLNGVYQKSNILGIYTVCQRLKTKKYKITESTFQNGIKNIVKNTGLKGRWQILARKPMTICDTGHNTHALKITLEKLKSSAYSKLHIILGFVNDKDVDGVFKLLPPFATYYFCGFDSFRALKPNELGNYAQKYNLKYSIHADVNMAKNAAEKAADKNDLIFIGGSTFVVAEIKNL